MLSSTYHLNAYKSLSDAVGLFTSASAIKATEAATVATSLGETLAGTLISTVTYPSSVTDFTGQILSWSQALEIAAEDATTNAVLMTEYADPSMLIQLTSGWNVYCRANALDASELTILAAIGDATEPDALLKRLTQ